MFHSADLGELPIMIESTSSHQHINGPAHVERPQISIMLTHAQEYNGDASRMHHADQSPHHIAHRITLGDDETIQPPLAPKRSIETPRLAHGIASNQSLAHHEDLIWIGEIAEFFQIRH